MQNNHFILILGLLFLTICISGCTSPSNQIGITRVINCGSDDDGDHTLGQIVGIRNFGDDCINLKGWQIKDSDGDSYTFKNIQISPERDILLFSGCGKDRQNLVYWQKSNFGVWNEEGGTAYLYDGWGNLVDQCEYYQYEFY